MRCLSVQLKMLYDTFQIPCWSFSNGISLSSHTIFVNQQYIVSQFTYYVCQPKLLCISGQILYLSISNTLYLSFIFVNQHYYVFQFRYHVCQSAMPLSLDNQSTMQFLQFPIPCLIISDALRASLRNHVCQLSMPCISVKVPR